MKGVIASTEDLHAPRERLTEQRLAAHRAIVSLMEEAQAMDWYRQRADDCDNAELRAVLVHKMNDEMEYAVMLVEWLRRNVAEFATSRTSSWALAVRSLEKVEGRERVRCLDEEIHRPGKTLTLVGVGLKG